MKTVIRIANGILWIFFFLVSLAAVCAGLYLLHTVGRKFYSVSDSWVGRVEAAVLVLFLLAFGANMVTDHVKVVIRWFNHTERGRRFRFKRTFGFNPGCHSFLKYMAQARVNDGLCELAHGFDFWGRQEIALRAQYEPDASRYASRGLHQISGYDLNEHSKKQQKFLKRLARLRCKNLLPAKDAFWAAHKLAKIFGFDVREHVGDYLAGYTRVSS